MKTKADRIIARRTEFGHHEFRFRGHTYIAARVRSDYGDFQWVIDRDGRCGWSQCDTLAGVRATILADRA